MKRHLAPFINLGLLRYNTCFIWDPDGTPSRHYVGNASQPNFLALGA